MSTLNLPEGVVRSGEEVAGLELEPLLVLAPLEEYLDRHGLGSGPLGALPLGAGHSNVTFLLRRGEERFVLRRPPRGPLPPSAHDVLREARLLAKLAPAGYRVPEVLVACEDRDVIGAPFYVMTYVEGQIPEVRLPSDYPAEAPRRIAEEMVAGLVELHEIDFAAAGLADFGRPDGYLERQLKVFRTLLEANATRPLPDLERVADWLADNLPSGGRQAIVHGDYRLGNMLFAPAQPRLVAVLDWEMATLGDPLADLGYMTEMWATEADPPNPVHALSPVTRDPAFPDRDELAALYSAATGCSLDALPWYRVLAAWKASIFLEGNYKRFLEGTTSDPFFSTLGEGVPQIAALAARRAEEA